MNTCQVAARNFVDMVIDNGQITDRALSDLNLALAGCTATFTYEYHREERITNPKEDGGVVVKWVNTSVDEDTVWHSGDLCTIVITQKSQGLFQRLSMGLLGVSYNNMEVRLTGMVR